MHTTAVLDFETTGFNPSWGDRPTEIAITLIRGGRVVDRFQSLMNPGRRIPYRVTALTGITNEMMAAAPKVERVMKDAAKFVGNVPVVAHHASFDKRFWDAEMTQLGVNKPSSFACTLLLSRRFYPDAPNHKLGTLVGLLKLPKSGRSHRAMADAEMASHLWLRIQSDVQQRYGVRNPTHGLLTTVQRAPRSKVENMLMRWGRS